MYPVCYRADSSTGKPDQHQHLPQSGPDSPRRGTVATSNPIQKCLVQVSMIWMVDKGGFISLGSRYNGIAEEAKCTRFIYIPPHMEFCIPGRVEMMEIINEAVTSGGKGKTPGLLTSNRLGDNIEDSIESSPSSLESHFRDKPQPCNTIATDASDCGLKGLLSIKLSQNGHWGPLYLLQRRG